MALVRERMPPGRPHAARTCTGLTGYTPYSAEPERDAQVTALYSSAVPLLLATPHCHGSSRAQIHISGGTAGQLLCARAGEGQIKLATTTLGVTQPTTDIVENRDVGQGASSQPTSFTPMLPVAHLPAISSLFDLASADLVLEPTWPANHAPIALLHATICGAGAVLPSRKRNVRRCITAAVTCNWDRISGGRAIERFAVATLLGQMLLFS